MFDREYGPGVILGSAATLSFGSSPSGRCIDFEVVSKFESEDVLFQHLNYLKFDQESNSSEQLNSKFYLKLIKNLSLIYIVQISGYRTHL
jgi:hypothetical protein